MKKLLAVAMLLAAAAVLGVLAVSATASPGGDKPTSAVFCLGGVTVTLSGHQMWNVSWAINHTTDGKPDPKPVYVHTWTHDEVTHTYYSTHEGENGVLVSAALGACALPAAPEPARIAYCSVAGNTWPDGTPIAPGTFLNLLADQVATDAHYTGATPAFWVEGVGLTCSLTPAQAALASASTTLVGGGGTPYPAGFGGIYAFIPKG